MIHVYHQISDLFQVFKPRRMKCPGQEARMGKIIRAHWDLVEKPGKKTAWKTQAYVGE